MGPCPPTTPSCSRACCRCSCCSYSPSRSPTATRWCSGSRRRLGRLLEGTVYPALPGSNAKAGSPPPGGLERRPARKYYRLGPAGSRRRLADGTTQLVRLADVVGSVLATVTLPPPTEKEPDPAAPHTGSTGCASSRWSFRPGRSTSGSTTCPARSASPVGGSSAATSSPPRRRRHPAALATSGQPAARRGIPLRPVR